MGDKPFGLKMRITFWPVAALIFGLSLTACGVTDRRTAPSNLLDTRSLIVLEQPPIIEARGEQELGLVRLQSTRLDPVALSARTDARVVGAEALPYLSNSEAGQKFLALGAPRAISRGSPPEICPVVGVAGGPGMASAGDAAVASVRACLAALDEADTPLCGCRLMALDGILTVPQAEMAYAGGTTARLRAPALGLDLMIVAEDLGQSVTLLRDLKGPVGLLRHGPDGEVELTLAGEPGRVFEGRSNAVGFRRGRLAERIRVEDDEGRAVTLLIGFSPAELAAGAAVANAGRPSG